MTVATVNPLNPRQQFLTTDVVRLEVETDPFTVYVASAAERAGRFIETKCSDGFTGHVGDTVTVSLELRSTNATTVRVYPYQGTGVTIADTKFFNTTAAYQRFTFTTTVTDFAGDTISLAKGSIGIYDDSGAGGTVYVRNLIVYAGDAAAAANKNLVPNPNGTDGAWWYTATDPSAFVHSASFANVNQPGGWETGIRYEQYTAGIHWLKTGSMPLDAGAWVRAGCRPTERASGKTVEVEFRFFDAAQAPCGVAHAVAFTDVVGLTGLTAGPAVQAPTGTKWVQLWFNIRTGAGGTLLGTGGAGASGDAFSFTNLTLKTYPTDPGGSLTYVEPYAFRNILGGSHEIEITRPTLDVGTLKATVVDPALDPAVDPADVIAVGRRCRAVAFMPDPYVSSLSERTAPRFIQTATRAGFLGHVGETVTVSLELKTVNPTTLRVYPYQGTGITISSEATFNTTATYQRFTFVTSIYDAGGDIVTFTDGAIGIYDDSGAGGAVYVRNLTVSSSSNKTVGTWQPLFTGIVRDLRTDYVLDKDNPALIRPVVTLVATDALADLANARSSIGYAGPYDLTTALEGRAPCPWLIENSGSFGYSSTPWSTNSNASLVDQVALVRDSLGLGSGVDSSPGHAWLDRRGVLQLWQTPPAEMDYPAWINPTGSSPAMTNGTSQILSGGTHAGVARNVYLLTAIAAGTMVAADAGTFPYAIVQPLRSYDVGVWVLAAGAARTATLSVEFEGEFAGVLQTVVVESGADVSTTNGGWRKLSGRVTAPAGARYMRRKVTWTGCAAGEGHYVDELTSPAARVATYTNNAGDAVATEAGDSYVDIAVDWAIGSIVNTVTVNYLRPAASAEDDSEVITYGPYVDQASIDANGGFGVTLTLNGFEDLVEIEAVARAILKRNAWPVRTVESMSVAVQNAAGIRHAILADLADILPVKHAGLVDVQPRVEQLVHRITTEQWWVDYTFTPAGSSALPQVIPAPTVGAVSRSTSGAVSVFRVGPLLIQTGTIAQSAVAGTTWTFPVTFAQQFSAAPVVTISPGNSSAGNLIVWGHGAPSVAGFTAVAEWNDRGSHSVSGNAQWIAIGPA